MSPAGRQRLQEIRERLPPKPVSVLPVYRPRELINVFSESGKSIWIERDPGNWLAPQAGYNYRQ